MHIVVMGAGGVGGYFGGRLAQAGFPVTFIARGAHLAAMRAHGLGLRSALGDATIHVRAVGDPAEAGKADAVLFAVKLWDTETAAALLKPVLAEDGVVVPFQNGVESIERIGAVLGAERVMGGVAYIAARIAEPGVIAHTGKIARLRIGAARPSQQAAAQALQAACAKSGFEAELTGDIRRALWEKFVFLVGMSGATALSRLPIGPIREDAQLRWLLEAAMRETWTVARARGIDLPEDFVSRQMELVAGFPAGTKSSMLGDLEAGAKLELPWLAGAVVRMAQEHGLEVPVNRTILAALTPYAGGRT